MYNRDFFDVEASPEKDWPQLRELYWSPQTSLGGQRMKKAKPVSGSGDGMTTAELCRFCNADEAWIVELVEHGVLEPEGPCFHEWVFRGSNIMRAKKAKRLGRDMGMNASGIAMVLDLLRERELLLKELARSDII